MIQKELILKDLQKQIHSTDDEQTKLILSSVIADILSEKYAIKIWE
jgi:hypothetical protein